MLASEADLKAAQAQVETTDTAQQALAQGIVVPDQSVQQTSQSGT